MKKIDIRLYICCERTAGNVYVYEVKYMEM